MPEKQYFREIKRQNFPEVSGKIAGEQYIQNLLSLGVGGGTSVFRTDQQGSWWGAEKFEDAPVSISVAGVITLSLGNGAITIDANGITQWVGSTPVGFWGFQENGF